MPNSHLTPDQITAIRDIELSDWALIRHLRSCLECQARLREARTLRVLLARSESVRSPHPKPEELAAYAEETLPSRDFRKLEAHVVACPQCFADLDAIRAQLRTVTVAGEAPPDWVVAAAARRFHPPRTPLRLGSLVVEWLRQLGPSLQLNPAVREPLAFFDAGSIGREGVPSGPSFLRRANVSPAASVAIPPRPSPEEDLETAEAALGAAMRPVPPEQESEPVEVRIGDLLGRITVRGRAPDQVKMIIIVTRHQDGTPVPGVQLALEVDQERLAAASTDAAGAAEFPLPQGGATLSFLSPVHAELTIIF